MRRDTSCNSDGKVAEKSNVCRVSGGGSIARILTILGRKPRSSSWSASSMTSTHSAVSISRTPTVLFRWSSSRPGVATRTTGGPCWNDEASLAMLVPPSTVITLLGDTNLSRSLASSAVCVASSLVGDSTRIGQHAAADDGGRLSTRCSAGNRKPIVLPVPVRALATTSLSAGSMQTGMASCCTRVILS